MATSDIPLEHCHAEPVSFMDAHSGAAHLTCTTGIIFSGVVVEDRIRTAVQTLARAWPMLGSRLRRISPEGPAVELLVPDSEHAVLSTTINKISKPLQEVESLPTRTSTISTQKLTRNSNLYRHAPQPTLEDYTTSQCPGFHLHVSCLTDATIFTLTFQHMLIDGWGASSVMRGLVDVLEGRNIIPCLEGDPWGSIVRSAGGEKAAPVHMEDGWRVFSPEDFGVAVAAELADLAADGPISQRTVYFPAAEIERLKNLAMEEIRAMGIEVPFVTSGDVIMAWLYKQFYGDQRYDPERTSRLAYAFNARPHLPENFPSSHIYLKNVYLAMIESKYPNSKIHDMSLGEIALMIRQLVNENTKREKIVEQIMWKYQNVGKIHAPTAAGERVIFGSNWLQFGLGELSIANAIEPSSGTGRVLDVYYEMPGLPRCSGVITYRDSDGGVMAEFQWAESNWTSGTIGEYAIERLNNEAKSA